MALGFYVMHTWRILLSLTRSWLHPQTVEQEQSLLDSLGEAGAGYGRGKGKGKGWAKVCPPQHVKTPLLLSSSCTVAS